MTTEERIREFLLDQGIDPETEKDECCGCNFGGITESLKKLIEQEKNAGSPSG